MFIKQRPSQHHCTPRCTAIDSHWSQVSKNQPGVKFLSIVSVEIDNILTWSLARALSRQDPYGHKAIETRAIVNCSQGPDQVHVCRPGHHLLQQGLYRLHRLGT